VLRIARKVDYFDAIASALGIEARVHAAAGRFDEAEAAARDALATATAHLGDSARATALDRLATVLAARGELSEALRVRREEQLPLLERLGDARARADASLQIAGLLEATGDVDDAVRVLRHESVPAFAGLGDARERALAGQKLAELLEARGEEEEGQRERVEAERGAAPFPGLELFDEDRADDFFGREVETVEALSKILESRAAHRWLQIDGPSGVGKSSFARAGIIPAVRAGNLPGPAAWTTIVMRPGTDPIWSLADALVSHARPPLLFDGTADALAADLRAPDGPPDALARFLHQHRPEAHGVLLLVDQLEETFTLAGPDTSSVKRFDALLAGVLDEPDAPFLLVTTVRSDFVGRMGELPALERRLRAKAVRYYLPPMDEVGLRAAIVKPAERAGLEYEAGLVDRIIADASTSPGALPLVAHVLQGLYARREGVAMTHRAYEWLGGVGGAIAKSADAILYGLDEDGRSRAKRMLLRLVKLGPDTEDTRQTAPRAEVLSAGGGGPEAERVLARLSGGRAEGESGRGDAPARLVVVSGERDHELVDIVHETLIQRWETLGKWIAEERGALALRDDVEKAARIWEASGAADSGLPKGAVLSRFHDVDHATLSAGARAYVERAERADTRSKRRTAFWILVIATGVTIVLVGALWLKERVEAQARVAEAQKLAAISALEPLPPRRLLLAREGWRAVRAGEASSADVLQALADAVQSAGGFRLPHEAFVWQAVFSPDGRRIATASTDGIARVWSAEAPGEPLLLRGHDGHVVTVAFSPDGRRLVTASTDGTARVWTLLRASQPLQSPEVIVLRGHGASVVRASFSPDGARILTASEDGTARVWSADGTGEPVVLRGHERSLTTASFNADGSAVVTASEDGTARVWNADGTGDPVVLQGHEAAVSAASFSPDGRVLTASADHTARVWRSNGRGDPVVLRGHTGEVNTAAFSPDGRWVLTASADATARVWSADGTGRSIVLDSDDGDLNTAVFSPDGQRILTASDDSAARVWKADGSGELLVFRAQNSRILGAAFSPDGRFAVSVSTDQADYVRVWYAGGRPEPVDLAGTSVVYDAAFRPDGRRVVAAVLGQIAVVQDADGTGGPVVLRGHEDELSCVAFAPDGERVATGSSDRTARIWNADGTGEPVVLRGHTDAVRGVAFSPDGQRVATASKDRTARIWSARTGEQLLSFPHEDPVNAVTFSPDGLRIATDHGKTARLWSADGTGDPIVLRGHDASVTSVAFSPDGLRVVTGSWDRTARIWNADGAGDPTVLRGHEGDVRRAAFSPDGARIITISSDMTARVWSADGAGSPLVLRDLEGPQWTATFAPDGKHALTAAGLGGARVWTVDGDLLAEMACERAGRNFTRVEWSRFFGQEPYRITCPEWPEAPLSPTAPPSTTGPLPP
jgi:WD40 repeat protein